MYLHLLVVALQLVLFQAALLLQTTLLVEFFEATLLQVVGCLADQVLFGLTPLLFLGLHENNRPELERFLSGPNLNVIFSVKQIRSTERVSRFARY